MGPLHATVLGGSLGRVGDLVPHDGVDHLQPLPRRRLQRLAVAHAPLAAVPVVLPEPAAAPDEGVAREDEQVLEPLVALPRGADRRERGARLPVSRGDSAVRCQMVVVGEVRDVDGDDELGRRAGSDARYREEAVVRRLLGEQGSDLRVEPGGLLRCLRYPPGEQPHLRVLGRDLPFRRPGRRDRGIPRGIDLRPVRAPRDRAERGLPGVEDPPRPAEGGEHAEPVRVGEVGELLEGRARLEQDAPQAVLVPGRAGDHVPALGGHRPVGLQPRVALGRRQQRVGDPERGLRDDHRVPRVGLGVAGEELGGLVRGESGQVADDERALGSRREELVEVALPVGDGAVGQDLAGSRGHDGPMGRLPDVEGEHGLAGGERRAHDAILQSSADRRLAPATPTLPGRGAFEESPAVSYQSSGPAAPVPATPPRALCGAGALGRARTPDRRSTRDVPSS